MPFDILESFVESLPGFEAFLYSPPILTPLSVSVLLGKEFQGRRLNVSMARRKTVPGFMRGGMPMRGGPNMMDRGGRATRSHARAHTKT